MKSTPRKGTENWWRFMGQARNCSARAAATPDTGMLDPDLTDYGGRTEQGPWIARQRPNTYGKRWPRLRQFDCGD